jgi:DNA-binding GntR family transcriptional regulator
MYTKNFLQSQAYDYIKEKILSGEFKPDTLYSETKLASEIGISRTPMREALQCLSQDGYISIVPSKGFQIRQLTDKDMLESIQVRCAIEGYCTMVIATQLHTQKGQDLLKGLAKALENMRSAAKLAATSHDALEQFIDSDHQFHLIVVEFMNNEEFNQMFQKLLYLIRLTSANALSKIGRIEGTLNEHEAYYNALKNGDGHEAYEIMIRHLLMPIEITE